MKLLLTSLLALWIRTGNDQNYSVVGAWYWSDSTQATSIFFKPKHVLSMHTGPKDEAILAQNLQEGKYWVKKGHLIIKWKNDETDSALIQFKGKNTLQITFRDKKNKNLTRKMVFVKVVDEEVRQDN